MWSARLYIDQESAVLPTAISGRGVGHSIDFRKAVQRRYAAPALQCGSDGREGFLTGPQP